MSREERGHLEFLQLQVTLTRRALDSTRARISEAADCADAAASRSNQVRAALQQVKEENATLGQRSRESRSKPTELGCGIGALASVGVCLACFLAGLPALLLILVGGAALVWAATQSS